VRKLYAANRWGRFSEAERSRLVLTVLAGWSDGSAPPADQTLDAAQRILEAIEERLDGMDLSKKYPARTDMPLPAPLPADEDGSTYPAVVNS
jgi:hypothetical protein